MRAINTRRMKKCVPAALIASVLFLLSLASYYHDGDVREAMIDAYMNSTLFAAEQVIYLDYRERQLRIYQRGSEQALQRLRAMRTNAPRRFAQRILADRSFRPFVREQGRLYFEPVSYQDWLVLRDELEKSYASHLLAPKLALAAEHVRPVQLLTYPLASKDWKTPLLEAVLLLLSLLVMSKRLSRERQMLVMAGGIIVGGLAYALLSDRQQPLLTGWSMAILALLGAGTYQQVQRCLELRSCLHERSWQVASALVLILIVATFLLQGLLLELPIETLFAGVGALLAGGLLYRFLEQGEQQDTVAEEDDATSPQWQYRVDLSRALEAMSAMDFERARQQLKIMVKSYPEQSEVIRHLYQVEKLWPKEDTYWACAQELIQLAVRQNDYQLALMLFNDIQHNAASKSLARQKLAPEFYHKMMMIFVAHDDLAKAEQSFLFLELAGKGEIIKDACLLLKEEYQQRRNTSKAQQYELLLQQL